MKEEVLLLHPGWNWEGTAGGGIKKANNEKGQHLELTNIILLIKWHRFTTMWIGTGTYA